MQVIFMPFGWDFISDLAPVRHRHRHDFHFHSAQRAVVAVAVPHVGAMASWRGFVPRGSLPFAPAGAIRVDTQAPAVLMPVPKDAWQAPVAPAATGCPRLPAMASTCFRLAARAA